MPGENTMNLQPIFLSPVVSKPPSVTWKHATPSASEHALYAFLRKRHENYLRKLSKRAEGTQVITSAPVPWDLPDTDLAEHVVCHARRRLLKRNHRHAALRITSQRQPNDSCNFKLVKTSHQPKSQEKATLLNEYPPVHLKRIPSCTSDIQNKKEKCEHKPVHQESANLGVSHRVLMEEAKEKTITMDIETVSKLKKQQREEIYALNDVMTEFEEEKFRTFLSAKV